MLQQGPGSVVGKHITWLLKTPKPQRFVGPHLTVIGWFGSLSTISNLLCLCREYCAALRCHEGNWALSLRVGEKEKTLNWKTNDEELNDKYDLSQLLLKEPGAPPRDLRRFWTGEFGFCVPLRANRADWTRTGGERGDAGRISERQKD